MSKQDKAMIDVYSWATPNGHKIHIMLEECGYRLGEAPHEGLFGSKRWAFVKSMFV